MASKDRLITYHLIINESLQCRNGWRMALYSSGAKKNALFNKLFVLCSVKFAFHQVPCAKKKFKKILSKLVQAASEMLGPVEVFLQPPLPHVVAILVLRSQVINHWRLFSCQYKQKAPDSTMATTLEAFLTLFQIGGKCSSHRLLFTLLSSRELIQYS